MLALAAILAAWLGIWGPVNINLKEWQPLMAAFIALGAASLAYKAAMAKVDADQSAIANAEEQKRINILIRLRFDMHVLSHEAMRTKTVIEDAEEKATTDAVLAMDDLVINRPSTLEEAWSVLHLFDADFAKIISRIRISLWNFDDVKSHSAGRKISANKLATNKSIERVKKATEQLNENCSEAKSLIADVLG